jgi:hypothetical protein
MNSVYIFDLIKNEKIYEINIGINSTTIDVFFIEENSSVFIVTLFDRLYFELNDILSRDN